MSEQPPITTGLGVSIPSAKPPPVGRTRPTIRRGKRTFRGFAVLDGAGNLVWGSFRPTEAAAVAAFQNWNPAVPGRAVPVTVMLDDGASLTIQTDS